MCNKYINILVSISILNVFFSFTSNAQVTEFISGEVGPSNSSNRDIAESFGEEWRELVREAGGCDTGFVSGDLEGLVPTPYPGSSVLNNNTVQLSFSGVNFTISNRDMSNIFGTAYADLIGDPGGVVSLGNGASLQDNSPRPSSLYNTSNQPDYLNEISGSGSSRNAYLIEFDIPQQAFGAWFGDLETNPLGTEAILRLFDASNNQIGTDTIIPADTAFLASNGNTTSDCGAAPSGSDITGCGNSTSRFIGFVSDPANLVKSMLVIVGDDDQPPSTFEGLTEHISLLGPSINTDFSCTDVNLTTIKRDINDPVEPGENLFFEILVTNFGTQMATSVQLSDVLPPEYEFVSATSDNGGVCTELSGVVDCNLGSIQNGEIVTVLVEVVPLEQGTFSNEVCVSSAEEDTFLDDNCSIQESTNEELDFVNLAVFKNDLKDPVEPGQNIFFEITVLNMGGLTATGVQLLDVLPPEYSFVSATPDNGGSCSEISGNITCSLGNIINGEIVTIQVEATSSVEGIFTNSVCVESIEGDFNELNNCAEENTMIMPFSEEIPVLPPGLASVLWNGFCDQQNFISMRNTCDEAVTVNLDLFGSAGTLLSSDLIALAPDQQIDYSVNNMAGFSVSDYGRVDLSTLPGGCISGEMGLFAPIGDGQMFSAPILSDSFEGKDNLFTLADGRETNSCFASFNTFQPSINLADSKYLTHHWLQLVNLDLQNKQEFKVSRFDMSGDLVISESYILNPGARIDIAAGHQDIEGNKYGLVEVSPKNVGANYTAQLFRYGMDETVLSGERMSSFSLADNCSLGFNDTKYLTISRGAGAANWLELSNLTNEPSLVQVDVFSSSGGLKKTYEFELDAKESIHFNATESLETGESGAAKIKSVFGNKILAKSTSYLYRPDGRILTSETAEAREALPANSFGSYNSFRNQLNWLRLFNVTNTILDVEITGYNTSGKKEISRKTISLNPKSGQDIDLNALFSLDLNQVGQFELKVSREDSILADVIRVQHNDNYSELQDIETFEVQ